MTVMAQKKDPDQFEPGQELAALYAQEKRLLAIIERQAKQMNQMQLEIYELKAQHTAPSKALLMCAGRARRLLFCFGKYADRTATITTLALGLAGLGLMGGMRR